MPIKKLNKLFIAIFLCFVMAFGTPVSILAEEPEVEESEPSDDGGSGEASPTEESTPEDGDGTPEGSEPSGGSTPGDDDPSDDDSLQEGGAKPAGAVLPADAPSGTAPVAADTDPENGNTEPVAVIFIGSAPILGSAQPEDSPAAPDSVQPADSITGDDGQNADSILPDGSQQPAGGTQPAGNAQPAGDTQPSDETEPPGNAQPSGEAKPVGNARLGTITQPEESIYKEDAEQPSENNDPGTSEAEDAPKPEETPKKGDVSKEEKLPSEENKTVAASGQEKSVGVLRTAGVAGAPVLKGAASAASQPTGTIQGSPSGQAAIVINTKSYSYGTDSVMSDGLTIYVKGLIDENREDLLNRLARRVPLDIEGKAVYRYEDEYLIDAEKFCDLNYDGNLCWAVCASNMLWTSGYAQKAVNPYTNKEFADVDEVFDYFRKTFTDEGGSTKSGIEYFLNGTYAFEGIDWTAQIKDNGVKTGACSPKRIIR